MAIYNLKNNLPDINRIFVFDTNILVYLNTIFSEKNKNFEEYSKISEFLIENKCKIYLDTLVLNEFINIIIIKKLEHKFNKKHDRNTIQYNQCLKNIKTIIENLKIQYDIFWSSNKINLFDSLDKIDYITTFNLLEFSDWSIKEITKSINGVLITNDNDFKNFAKNNEIDIFTIK